jgi:hypothetical protein
MKDILVHLALFLAIAVPIVLLSSFFSEPDDRRALASFPRRLLVFVAGCGILCGLLLLLERTFASVD